MLRQIVGVVAGLLVGLALSVANLISLWLWNAYLDPLARALSRSDHPRGWNGESLHGIDLVPVLIGAVIYYVGIATLCGSAAAKWPRQVSASWAAWTAFGFTSLLSLALASLSGLMVVLAYNAKGLSFLLFFSAVYTLIFAVVPIVASFKSARIVIDEY